MEPASSFGAPRMKSQVVVLAPMSIAASMITVVATTTTVDADMITAAMSAMKTAVAANSSNSPDGRGITFSRVNRANRNP